jgi:hypothetical protein
MKLAISARAIAQPGEIRSGTGPPGESIEDDKTRPRTSGGASSSVSDSRFQPTFPRPVGS